MSGPEHSERADEMPPVTPEAISIRVAISAFLTVIGPKRGNAFLREMARLYSDEDEMAKIFPIRPASQRPAVVKARQQSFMWFRITLPLFMAALRRG